MAEPAGPVSAGPVPARPTATDGAVEVADVVVVGAGVTGALIAWKLAAAGRRVVVLEAGPERSDRIELVGAFARSVGKGASSPYLGTPADVHAPSPGEGDRGEGHYIQAGPDPFKSTYERLSGGSTWHWLGNAPRLLPTDFRLRSTYGVGVDWPIGYDDLEPWYVEAEHELGVSGDHDEWHGVLGAWRSAPFPMPPIWRSHGDEVVARDLDGQVFDGTEVHLRSSPQARNSIPYQGRPPCAGNSSCVPICPIAAKYDATVHLRRAERLPVPAEVRTRCVVTRLVPDGDGRIARVRYVRWSEDGRTRTDHEMAADLVVVAAHAIETPLLLLESGLARLGPVGRNLMDHPQGFGGAILPRPVFPFRGPPVVSGIDEFRDGPVRGRRAAFRISVGNDGWGRLEPPEETIRRRIFDDGLLGAELRAAVNHRVTHMLRMSYSTEMLPDPDNRVEVGGHDARGNPRPKLHFSVPDYNRQAFAAATALLRQLFTRLGASETAFSYPETAYFGAGHIMGTCRMGPDARTSVVDDRGRAHEHPNLYLAGAALFPTIGTANPTLTAAALALRTAAAILDDRASVTVRTVGTGIDEVSEPLTVPASRARLLSLLSEACELEHALACSYLYAAFSLKRDLADGIDWTEQQRNRRWASRIYHVAAQEMLHLAQAWNLLDAVGGMPYYARPNFPLAARHYPLNVALVLRRFDLATLDRFLYYETPAHNDPRAGGPGPPLPPAAGWPIDESFPYTSVGQLYGEIRQVIDELDEAELFVRSHRAQAGPQLVDFADIIPVVDRASATAAIDRITLQGEGITEDREDSHYGVFRAIRADLAALDPQPGPDDPPSHLVHPVADNPYVRRRRDQIPAAVFPSCRDGIETTAITDELAVLALDLFDDTYVAMLQAMAYAFVNVEDGASLAGPLARASLELMTTVLKPLGEAVCQLPSGQPGLNAGPTFALSRHCYLPASAPVSRVVFGERLAELGAHARLLGTAARDRCAAAAARDQIDSAADNLERIASPYAAHRRPRQRIL